MQQITPTALKPFIVHVVVRLNEPVFVWGSPGVGKTKVIEQTANENGWMHTDIRLGQYDTVDLRGVPGRNDELGATVWYPPATLPVIGNSLFPDDRPILLSFDEMNTAAPSVQAAG